MPHNAPQQPEHDAAHGQWLDRMYNNLARVPDHGAYFERWAADSALARQQLPGQLELRYGDGAAETLDIFAAKRSGAPVLVFVHGGYWRAMDKADHSFLAPAFHAAGACVVIPNYALCPAVSVADISRQMERALAWVWHNCAQFGGDPERIVVAGHSAGGHLASLLLGCDWPRHAADLPPAVVRRALSISGLYDLAPIRQTPFLQPSLQLTPQQVQQLSPAGLPAPPNRLLYTVAGGQESAEFLRQNTLLQQAWGRRTVPVAEVLPGLHHFSIVDALVRSDHRLHQLALALLA